MITIPSGELTGLLRDVIPFACPHDDIPDLNVVRLHWDGDMLHASTTDTLRTARSTWHPDDDDEGDTKPSLVSVYGGADDPWSLYMRLDDAKALVSHFKLPTKEAMVPITLDHHRGKLTVARSAAAGLEEVEVAVVGRMVEFPDLDTMFATPPNTQPVTELGFIGRHLADLGAVRQRGTLTLAFCGPQRATRIRIGRRFVATIRPDQSLRLAPTGTLFEATV